MKEELIGQLKHLKEGKAPEKDKIENKAWKLMPKKIGEAL